MTRDDILGCEWTRKEVEEISDSNEMAVEIQYFLYAFIIIFSFARRFKFNTQCEHVSTTFHSTFHNCIICRGAYVGDGANTENVINL